jgi:hypothetical protein
MPLNVRLLLPKNYELKNMLDGIFTEKSWRFCVSYIQRNLSKRLFTNRPKIMPQYVEFHIQKYST